MARAVVSKLVDYYANNTRSRHFVTSQQGVRAHRVNFSAISTVNSRWKLDLNLDFIRLLTCLRRYK